MDQVKTKEEQDLDSYIIALENKVNEIAQDLVNVQAEKEQLFNEYIDSLHKIYRIGGQ